MNFIGIILFIVVVAFLVWQVVGLVKDLRARFSKRNKSLSDSNESEENNSKGNKV